MAAASRHGGVVIWHRRTARKITETIALGELFAVVAIFHTTLVTGDSGGFVRFWDCHTGRQIGPTVTRHKGTVKAVAIDGRTLITADENGGVLIWQFTDPAAAGPATAPQLIEERHIDFEEWKLSAIAVSGDTLVVAIGRVVHIGSLASWTFKSFEPLEGEFGDRPASVVVMTSSVKPPPTTRSGIARQRSEWHPPI